MYVMSDYFDGDKSISNIFQSEIYLPYIPTLAILNERIIDHVGNSSDVNEISPHQLLCSDKIHQKHSFKNIKLSCLIERLFSYMWWTVHLFSFP